MVDVKIMYSLNPEYMIDISPITKENIQTTHVEIPIDITQYIDCEKYDTNEDYLEKIFELLNINNPLSSEKWQEWIRKNCNHTSMSVGDCVVLNNNIYVVDDIGFKKL